MSIQAMVWVMEQSQAEGSDRLVLLAIANHADAIGWNAWPSIPRIAQEARVSERTVYRCVSNLERMGELKITHGGRGAGDSNHYVLLMGRVTEGDKLSPSTPVRVTNATDKGDILSVEGCHGVTRTVLNRQEPSRAHAHASTGEAPPPAPQVAPWGGEEHDHPERTQTVDVETIRALAAKLRTMPPPGRREPPPLRSL